MKSSLVVALVVSLLAHGLLALGLVAYLEYAPEPDVLATLDLSSVELSFAGRVEETAAVAAMPATPPAKPQPKPRPVEPPAPQAAKALPLPPDPAAPKFREPKEEPRKLEDARQETRDENDERRETRDEKDERREKQSAQDKQAIEQADKSISAPRQARVDAPPRPRRSIRPDYPKGARRRGEQGDVTLEIRVSAEGVVDRVTVVASSGFADLDAAAVKAAKAAKFTPAKSGREAVASTARLKLSFKLK